MEQFIEGRSSERHLEELPSDRQWGVTVGAAFFVLALFSRKVNWLPDALISLSISLFCLALFFPNSLHLLNKNWMKLGLALGRITNPLLVGLVYLVVITPFSFFLRVWRGSFLQTRIDKNAYTYWNERSQGHFSRESLKRQF